ncbi:MAG: hypothetical protein AAF798_10095 [Bacteroidota bacterium]
MYMHPSEFIYYPGTTTPAEQRENNRKKAVGATGLEATPSEKIDISTSQALVTIACVTVFPMIYLIGKIVLNWF